MSGSGSGTARRFRRWPLAPVMEGKPPVKSILLYLLGVPIIVIILLNVFGVL
jgi:hypothetical protein